MVQEKEENKRIWAIMQIISVEQVKGPPITHLILHGFSHVESVTWLSTLDIQKVHK